MYGEHLSEEDIKKFVTFEGPLKSEEGEKWIKFSQEVNGHIADCKDCRDRVRKAQELYDSLGTISEELGIPRDVGISMFDEIPDGEERRVEDNTDPQKEIKNLIIKPGNLKGVKCVITHPPKDNDVCGFREKEEKITSEKVKMLYEEYGIVPPFFKQRVELLNGSGYNPGGYVPHKSTMRFTSYENCEEDDKQKIEEFEVKMEELQNGNKEEYDEPGMICFETQKRRNCTDRDYTERIIRRRNTTGRFWMEIFRTNKRTKTV